jgi:hypothetical protein
LEEVCVFVGVYDGVIEKDGVGGIFIVTKK